MTETNRRRAHDFLLAWFGAPVDVSHLAQLTKLLDEAEARGKAAR